MWQTQAGAQVQELQKGMEEMRRNIQALESERKQSEGKNTSADATPSALPAPPQAALPPMQTPVLPAPASAANPGRAADQLGAPGDQPPPTQRPRGILRIDVGDAREVPGAGGAGRGTEADTRKSADSFVPAGSFFRGITLAGLDAPTGGQVQQNPHPIIFRVTEFAQLPNKFRADLKECFVTGNGYGDISSERAYIRLDRLSCIDEHGGAIEVELKGYAAGEDGKAGLRGRLISKQGQVLANALTAGIASGIGNAFSQSYQTQSVSPLGSTTTVEKGKEMQAGLGTGVGRALDKLAGYYIQLAEKMFPVIEIDAGREVDLVVTKGLSLERPHGDVL
jgi:conjugal transfer pilus assembly protein TraB